MEITTLNKEFFGKCTLKQRLGLVSNRQGTIVFKFKNSSQEIVINNDDDLKIWNDRKFNRKKLKPGVTIIGKMTVQEPAEYLICQHDSLTLNGHPVKRGSVVVKTATDTLLYNDLYLFCAEVTNRNKADLKLAVEIYKSAKGNPQPANFQPLQVNNRPQNVIELSGKDRSRYVLRNFLIKIAPEGGAYKWGCRLQDMSSGQMLELSNDQVKDLVLHGQVKDTVLNDNNELEGVNYDIDMIDQDYAS